MAFHRVLCVWALVLVACTSGPQTKAGDGYTCGSDSDCKSSHCVEGECSGCLLGSDCQGGGRLCILGPDGGPYGICSDGCLDTGCPTGFGCDPNTLGCYAIGPAVLPTCGQSDFSGGYDAGFGPGPVVTSSSTCAACVGCPLGSECVCGESGLVGGVRCSAGDDTGALACFATGALGDCQVFPGDCATNTQCQATPATPLCTQLGNCVQCLRDLDCPQDAGGQGCVQNQCGGCCHANADCAPSSPYCDQGFCYPACQAEQSCTDLDAGTDHCCAGLCQSAVCADAG